MSNLVEQYGPDWFTSKFNGSFFMHEDTPHIVKVVAGRSFRTNVPCRKLIKEGSTVTALDTTVRTEVFTDASVFSVRNLGWRTWDSGKVLEYFSRNNNSYYRGLSIRNLTVAPSHLTMWLRGMGAVGYDSDNEAMQAYKALKPDFIPLTEGIAKIRAEEIISFAASPTIAVLPSEDDRLVVMFKQKQAGFINGDNSMSLLIPELNSYMENM